MKKILFAVLYQLGATRLAAWCNRKRVTILCYHGVTEQPAGGAGDVKGLHVNRLRFAQQLNYLQRNYAVISLGEYLLARREGRMLQNYSVVLTFDDGFRNFLTVAAPILAERKLPATVFLITDKASADDSDQRSSTWTPVDDRRYLSWSEALALKARYGFEFGSHTCSHSPLLGLSEAETERELLHSFNQLVSRLDVAEPTLSYPKGEYSNLLADEARKLGYSCALTTDRGQNEFGHDRFTLGRTLIGNHDDPASFAVRVSGLRCWMVSLVRGSNDLPVDRLAHVPEKVPAIVAGLQLDD